MDLPVEIQWHQLEFLNDAKTVACSMQVCRLWNDILHIINKQIADEVYSNLHKYTYTLLKLNTLKIGAGPLSRLRFTDLGPYALLGAKNRLIEEISDYVTRGLDISNSLIISVIGNELTIVIGFRWPIDVSIHYTGAIYCKVWLTGRKYKICDADGVCDEITNSIRNGEINVPMEKFIRMFRTLWSKYYNYTGSRCCDF